MFESLNIYENLKGLNLSKIKLRKKNRLIKGQEPKEATTSGKLSDEKKAVMKEAKLYQNSNSLQKRDASDILKEFSSVMRWRDQNDKSIDIGCGDGSVTVDLLRPILPGNHKLLLGCDLSKEMVRHADECHKDERTQFRQVDIEDDIPSELIGQFHHAFSFYALHWIQDQELALRNIHTLLTAHGDCLLIFLAHMPAFDVYRILSANSKWKQYMYDVEKYISPYHDSKDPGGEVKKLMTDVGFQQVNIKCIEKHFYFQGVEILKKSVMAINPFSHRLPRHMKDEFFADYLDIVREMGLIEDTNNNEGEAVNIRTQYTLLVAYGVRP